MSLSAAFRCLWVFGSIRLPLATHRAILHVFCWWLRLWQSCHRFLLKRGAISKCVRVSRPFSFFPRFICTCTANNSFFIFSSPFLFVYLSFFPAPFLCWFKLLFLCMRFICLLSRCYLSKLWGSVVLFCVFFSGWFLWFSPAPRCGRCCFSRGFSGESKVN